jgi:hypothetical protein
MQVNPAWLKEHGSRSMAQGAWLKEHGSRSMAQGAWLKERGSRSVAQGAMLAALRYNGAMSREKSEMEGERMSEQIPASGGGRRVLLIRQNS